MFRTRGAHRRRLAVLVGATLVAVGVASTVLAIPALAKTPAQIAAETSPRVAGTPCTSAASACVDVDKKQAWLIKDGKIVRGPVRINTGGPGKETPTGNVFRVYRKDIDHKSREYTLPNGQPSPMPYSVFFEDGGIAFHNGDPARASAGCIRLELDDAKAFYNFLEIGNHVQVMDGPVSSDDVQARADSSSDGVDNNDDE